MGMSDADQSSPRSLEEVIDRIEATTEGSERVAVRDILDAFADRLFGPLLAVPGLIVVSPLGAIPGAPGLVAVMVVLVAGQLALGRDWPWMPRWISERWVERERVVAGLERARPIARRVDRVIRPRCERLVSPPMPRVLAGLCMLLGVSLVPLGLIPFAVAIPGVAMMLLGLALIARDGLAASIGLAFAAGTVAAAIMLL